MTDVYRETEGQPELLRRAKALRRVVERTRIFILEDELIVGRTTGKIRGAPPTPELNAEWYPEEMERFSQREVDRLQPMTEEEKAELTAAAAYWRDRSVAKALLGSLTREQAELDGTVIGGPAYCLNNQYHGHLAPGYGRFLQMGALGLMAELEQRKAALREGWLEDIHRRTFYEAAISGLESAVLLARRYGELALDLAAREASPRRRRELEEIAAVCRKVPAQPAETFREAVQAVTFLYLVIMMESPGPGTGFARLDQYLYPYYQRDKAAGRLTDDEAYLLLGMLYLKCSETVFPYREATASAFAGFATDSNITLGGVTPEGGCGVNELSYLCLEAERAVALNAEDIVVRVSPDTPGDFLLRACRIAREMNGKLKFVGDPIILNQLVHDGHSLEEARDYAITGCNSPTVPGRSLDCPGGVINAALLLELALHDGYAPVLGRQLGVRTGDAGGFRTYEEVWAAFQAQVRRFVPLCHTIKNLDKELMARFMPAPFLSTLYPECLERGRDIIQGGTAPRLSFALSFAGAVNVGDALTAIRQLVFRERRLTMAELLEALDHDFEGYEQVLRWIEAVPKYGNNEDEADQTVNQVFTLLAEEVERIGGFAGAVSTAAASCITTSVPLGRVVGALPDGRRRGQPLAEGGISPHQGRNVSGPTATLRSVTKINHMLLRNGSVLNMRFDPSALDREDKLRKFAQMIQTYVDDGGFLVQFNIVSTETLRAAQAHPEEYRDLLVRVATYAAKFTELSAVLQEDIIDRVAFT